MENNSLLSFNERTKEAQIKYAALIVEMNIIHQNANKILSFFSTRGKKSSCVTKYENGSYKTLS